jgi:rubrerythrin
VEEYMNTLDGIPGGEPVCHLDRVCPDCGAIRDDPAEPCPRCGWEEEHAGEATDVPEDEASDGPGTMGA